MLKLFGRWSLVVALALVSVLAGRQARACPVDAVELPQILEHRAVIVAEGTATADQFTFAATKFWKGTTSATVRLENIKPSTCGGPPRPTIAGERYLLFIDSMDATTSESVTLFAGEASVFRIESVTGITRYLAHSTRISRRELIAKLYAWHYQRVTDFAMVRWIQDTIPLAKFDDWVRLKEEDEDEVSLNLNVLWELDYRIGRLSDEIDLSCQFSDLRDRVVPAFLKVLEAEHLTPDLIASFEQLPYYTLCPDD